MIRDTLGNAGGDTQTRRVGLPDPSPKRGHDTGTPGGVDEFEEAYPAEYLPVGDPRPQRAF